MKHVKQLQLEIPIHASNDDSLPWACRTCSAGLGLFPRKIFVGKCGKVLVTVTQSAPFLDRHFPALLRLDGVFLGRALVKRPQVTIDAGIYDETLVENLDRAGSRNGCFRLRVAMFVLAT